jgi:hypothetical protein
MAAVVRDEFARNCAISRIISDTKGLSPFDNQPFSISRV